jgi:DNA-directed RNA polymerase
MPLIQSYAALSAPSKALPICLQPLLERLLEEFQQNYPGIEFPPLPPKGDLDLDQLREAAYFFS